VPDRGGESSADAAHFLYDAILVTIAVLTS
jgi:hypothetical protein